MNSMKGAHDAKVLPSRKCLPAAVWLRAGLFLLSMFVFAPRAHSYAVLTHEAIIDSAWNNSIQPLLLRRFPQSTPDDLRKAHAYAYAGCILQDMGYYPFGSRFFSDLVHYVRSGDFVVNLIRESQDLNEYAFALGSLAHYAADTMGHSIAVNPAVGLLFPKLARRFGKEPTYADKPVAHMQVEFGFDVLQVSHGNYAPQAYHDFIGFEVSKPVLERAFRDTYSVELKDVFADLDLALGTYRKAVSAVIPTLTRAAWRLKKDELVKASPKLTRKQFVYNISRASYQKEWGGKFKQPGIGARLIAFLVRILPKVGPLRALDFPTPTPQTDLLFQTSFDRTLSMYRDLLGQHSSPRFALDNRDFDTGHETHAGEYSLADTAYCELAVKLAKKDPAEIDPKLRANVIAFFRDFKPPTSKKDAERWKETSDALAKLE